MIHRKETVKRAVHFQDPAYMPLSYTLEYQKSDIIFVPVEKHFEGPDANNSEWGFVWERLMTQYAMGNAVPLIHSPEELKRYTAPDPFDKTRFDLFKEKKAEFGEDRYYIADLVLSGFTIASLLRGIDDFLAELYTDREFAESILDVVFGFESALVPLIASKGFDAVGFADDWGMQNATLISPALFREVFLPRYKKLFDLIHCCGMDVYFHCCGMVYDFIGMFVEMGVDALNLGQPSLNGIKRVGEAFSGQICFAFPVSYQTTGVHGTREEIFSEVREMLDYCAKGKAGLIGCVLQRMTMLGATERQSMDITDAFETLFGRR